MTIEGRGDQFQGQGKSKVEGIDVDRLKERSDHLTESFTLRIQVRLLQLANKYGIKFDVGAPEEPRK